MAKKQEPEKRSWQVPYRLTTQGIADVEATSAEEAEAMVERGEFESHPGEERVDWEKRGKAKPS